MAEAIVDRVTTEEEIIAEKIGVKVALKEGIEIEAETDLLQVVGSNVKFISTLVSTTQKFCQIF